MQFNEKLSVSNKNYKSYRKNIKKLEKQKAEYIDGKTYRI